MNIGLASPQHHRCRGSNIDFQVFEPSTDAPTNKKNNRRRKRQTDRPTEKQTETREEIHRETRTQIEGKSNIKGDKRLCKNDKGEN